VANSAPVQRTHVIASIAAFCAIVVVVGFVVAMTWNGAAGRAAFEQKRGEEIAQESRIACEKWKMPAGTQEHIACIADLKVIRGNQDKRYLDDSGM
jgi:hypothetical protein